MNYQFLYNPLSGNGKGERALEDIKTKMPNDTFTPHDLTKISDYKAFYATFKPDDKFILAGGDGTLNRFVNNIQDIEIKHEIFFFGQGSGNDFLNDLYYPKKLNEQPILTPLNKYLENLPTVYVNDIEAKFINDIGFGIDGYACEEADIIREKSKKAINYTWIAFKGLVYKFTPRNAKITIDGVTREYKKVWLAPTMNGRFFGGGMMATPNQDRLNPEHKVSLLVFSGTGRLQTLLLFPKVFKGTHITNKHCEIYRGYDITVEFDKPCALQIDGDTVLNVKKYHVIANK